MNADFFLLSLVIKQLTIILFLSTLINQDLLELIEIYHSIISNLLRTTYALKEKRVHNSNGIENIPGRRNIYKKSTEAIF